MQTTIQTKEVVQEATTKKKPLWRTQVGAFSVSIWENEWEIRGRRVPVKCLSMTKSYRTRDGEMRNSTTYLMEHEVPKVIVALHSALAKLAYGKYDDNEEGGAQ